MTGPSDAGCWWTLPVVTSFNKLIKAVTFSQQDVQPMNTRLFVIDERLMEYTSEWCTACNLEATNHIRIKDLLFRLQEAKGKNKNAFMPFADVPNPDTLPMGLKLMHDAYLFIYLICSFIAVLLRNISTLSSSEPTQTRVSPTKHAFVYEPSLGPDQAFIES
jgi:hypothetical protein